MDGKAAVRVCGGCGKVAQKGEFRVCGRCRAVVYCGEACQKSAWSKHKPECPRILADIEVRDLGGTDGLGPYGLYSRREVAEGSTVFQEPSLCQNQSNALLESLGHNHALALTHRLLETLTLEQNQKQKEPQSTAYKPLAPVEWLLRHRFTRRAPDPLPPSAPPLVSALGVNAGSKKKALAELDRCFGRLSVRFGVSQADVAVVWRTMVQYLLQCFDVMSNEALGAALYRYAALMNHSCDPNCVALMTPLKVTVLATRAIAAGEPLTISYRSCHALPSFRHSAQSQLQAMFQSPCLCNTPSCLSKTTNKPSPTSLDQDVIAAAHWFHRTLATTQPPTPASTPASASAGAPACASAAASAPPAVDQKSKSGLQATTTLPTPDIESYPKSGDGNHPVGRDMKTSTSTTGGEVLVEGDTMDAEECNERLQMLSFYLHVNGWSSFGVDRSVAEAVLDPLLRRALRGATGESLIKLTVFARQLATPSPELARVTAWLPQKSLALFTHIPA